MGSQPSSLSSNRQIQGFIVTKQISARRKINSSLNKKFSNSEVLTIIDYDCKDFDQKGIFLNRPKSETVLTHQRNTEAVLNKINGRTKGSEFSNTAEPKKLVQINDPVNKDKTLSITNNKTTKMEEVTAEEFDHLDHWVHKNEPYVRNSDIHHSDVTVKHKSASNLRNRDVKAPKDDKTVVTTKMEKGGEKTEKSGKDLQDSGDKDDNEEIDDISPEEVFEQAKAEEIEKVKDTFEALKQLQTDRTEEGYFSDELRILIWELSKSYFALKKFKLKRRVQYRLEVNELLIQPDSNIVDIYCHLLLELLPKSYRGETGKPIGGLFKPMSCMLQHLMNYSDSLHMGFCKCIINQRPFLKALIQKLNDLAEPEVEGKIKENDSILVRLILGLLHNLTQTEDFVPDLRELGIIKAVTPFLESKADIRKLVALAVLAGCVNEEESMVLKTHTDLIKFILKCLKKATHNKIRRCNGWSVREITRVIRMASKSDNNKRMMYTEGAGPILVELANNSKSDEELKEAVGALWTLSFDKENQKEMVEGRDTGVIDTLVNLFKTTENRDVKRICGKALWTMREILKSSEHYKAIGEEFSLLSSTSPRDSDTHVMLSYNWGHQPIVREICQNLRNNGIKVWMDVDDLQGSTLQAMACAVEKADIVLVCYSQKYKNSDNCRAEAEYAFQLKKKVIPLKMEGYKADGWLGFIIGAKLFYDFSGKYPFEGKIGELIKDVHLALNTMKRVVKEVPTVKLQPQPAVQIQSAMVANSNTSKGGNTDLEPVKKWSPQHVGKWLDKNNLPRNLLGRLSGIEIAFLHVLVQESPDMYYKTIGDQLGVKDILTMAKLRFALEKLNVNI